MKLFDKVKELKTKYLNTNKKQDNTIYCRICGKKINRHATYCSVTGGEQVISTTTTVKENNDKLYRNSIVYIWINFYNCNNCTNEEKCFF